MRVLVTGAGGFVGGAIASEFVSPNDELFLASRRKSPSSAFVDQKNCFTADLTKASEVSRLNEIDHLDAVIHAAGVAHQFGRLDERNFHLGNVLTTGNLLNLAKSLAVKHFVLISSVSVYGRATLTGMDQDQEDLVCCPIGPYAESKLESENISAEFCRVNNIHLTILRPATVIGEGDPGNVRRLVEAIDNRAFRWIGSGRNYKSLVYKKDVATACRVVLAGNPNTPAVFNVTGEPLPMHQIVSVIADRLGAKVPFGRIPVRPLNTLLRAILKFRKIDRLEVLSETIKKWTADDVFSGAKIGREFGFFPETHPADALRLETAAYMKCR